MAFKEIGNATIGARCLPIQLNVFTLFCVYGFVLFQILHINFAFDDFTWHYFKFS